MPKMNIYVPKHLYERRHELPDAESFAGIFNDALEKRLDELDAQRKAADDKDVA